MKRMTDMKELLKIIQQLLCLAWVVGCVFIYQFWHWDGVGVLIMSLPGVAGFLVLIAIS